MVNFSARLWKYINFDVVTNYLRFKNSKLSRFCCETGVIIYKNLIFIYIHKMYEHRQMLNNFMTTF